MDLTSAPIGREPTFVPAPTREARAPSRALGPWLDRELEKLTRAALTTVPMWILGPPGTPRQDAAEALHDRSARWRQRFVALDCRAMGSAGAEAALFGDDRAGLDADGDADDDTAGPLLLLAQHGTLFLDEVEALDARAQARLVRFLERRSILRRGFEIGLDVRVLSASSIDLKGEVLAERFRPDLLYRLAAISLRIPPLSSRREEIMPRATELLEAFPRGGFELSASTASALEAYAWPGNDRELELVIARASLVSPSTRIEPASLFLASPADDVDDDGRAAVPGGRVLSFEEHESMGLRAALAETGGNITRAAEILGIGRATFYRKARKYGVAR